MFQTVKVGSLIIQPFHGIISAQRFVRWMLFPSFLAKDPMQQLAKEVRAMLKALTTIEFFKQDEEERPKVAPRLRLCYWQRHGVRQRTSSCR
jgi:adenine C2-methylase RlmN of 23S rRNA A2503 and tRNA A37